MNTKNKTLDTNKTSNSQTTISQETSTSSQQSEIENLKKEVEALKNSRPNTVIKEVPKSESGVASIVDCRV